MLRSRKAADEALHREDMDTLARVEYLFSLLSSILLTNYPSCAFNEFDVSIHLPIPRHPSWPGHAVAHCDDNGLCCAAAYFHSRLCAHRYFGRDENFGMGAGPARPYAH